MSKNRRPVSRSRSVERIIIKKPGYLESCGYGEDDINARDMSKKNRRIALRKAIRTEASDILKNDDNIRNIPNRKDRTRKAIRKSALSIFRRLNVLTIFRKNKYNKDSMEDKEVFNEDKEWIKVTFIRDDGPETLKEVWENKPKCYYRK